MSLLELQLPQEQHPVILVGAGGVARAAHLPACRKTGLKVIAVFDPGRERACALGQEFAIDRVASSLGDAIAKAPPDAVHDVAASPCAFFDIAGALPERSSALIQKPMGEGAAKRARYAICATPGNSGLRYASNDAGGASAVHD